LGKGRTGESGKRSHDAAEGDAPRSASDSLFDSDEILFHILAQHDVSSPLDGLRQGGVLVLRSGVLEDHVEDDHGRLCLPELVHQGGMQRTRPLDGLRRQAEPVGGFLVQSDHKHFLRRRLGSPEKEKEREPKALFKMQPRETHAEGNPEKAGAESDEQGF
jgi:hypothetical protein